MHLKIEAQYKKEVENYHVDNDNRVCVEGDTMKRTGRVKFLLIYEYTRKCQKTGKNAEFRG